jgi:AsmA protein
MAEPTEQGQEGETSVTTQWSNEVLDLTGLRELNSSLEITAKEFRAFDYEVSQTAMVVNLKGGVLKADLNRLDLYKGLGVGSFVLDGSQTVPRLTMRLDLADVDAEPFLMAATSKRLATGKGQFTLDAHTSGRSQKEWMDRLAGKGHLFLHDGELIGVDLNKMVLILGSLTGYQPEGQREEEAVEGEVGENRSTEFVEMGGTFLIANGILQSQDFKLENTLVNLAGSGDVDIGEQMIDFRIDPGLNREDGGLKLALKVTGPWHDMAFRPDMQQMVRQKLMETLGVEEDSPVGQILDLFNRKTKKQPEPSD